MWERSELKTRAKNVLRNSYWKAFLVSIIIAIVGGNTNGKINWNLGSNNDGINNRLTGESGNLFLTLLVLFGIFMIVVVLVVIALRVFVGYPLEVGGRKYFIRSAESDVNLNYLGYGFESGHYMGIIKTMLWRALLNFLWYLLLIIPGIVKGYAYRMVPYILADNPDIGYKRAVELSNEMTRGHKFDIFVLDLSFILWYLLGLLCLVVGTIFVYPYVNATNAELYLVLRQNALTGRMCTHKELNLPEPELA